MEEQEKKPMLTQDEIRKRINRLYEIERLGFDYKLAHLIEWWDLFISISQTRMFYNHCKMLWELQAEKEKDKWREQNKN